MRCVRRVGVENEKFGYQLDTLEPMTLENTQDLLEGMASRYGHKRYMECGTIAGLEKVRSSLEFNGARALPRNGLISDWHSFCCSFLQYAQEGQSCSLEPGCQIELSGAPLEDLHAVKHELDIHLEEVLQRTIWWLIFFQNTFITYLNASVSS